MAKLGNLIEDKFFYDKFDSKIHKLLTSYIIFSSTDGFISLKLREGGDSVAQYKISCEKFIENVDGVLEMLEELKYLNLVELSPLFLQNQKNLLAIKLELREKRDKIKEPASLVVVGEQHEKQVSREEISPENIIKKSTKLNQSKKKILEFIKLSPNIRTKDIISEFNALSDRTVKRNLTDLLRTGLIKKRVDSKAVYYYVSE